MAYSGRGLRTWRCLTSGPTVMMQRDTYLQVADRHWPEDLNVGCVGVREGLAVPQPHDGHVGGMGLDLARDVDCVPLPSVRRDLAVDLRRVWKDFATPPTLSLENGSRFTSLLEMPRGRGKVDESIWQVYFCNSKPSHINTHSALRGRPFSRPLQCCSVPCKRTDRRLKTWRISWWGRTPERHSSPLFFHPESKWGQVEFWR